jgi:hypothetical protein
VVLKTITSFSRFVRSPSETPGEVSIGTLTLLLAFQYLFALGLLSFATQIPETRVSGEATASLTGFLFLQLMAPVKEELKYRLWLGDFQFQNFIGSMSILATDTLVSCFYLLYDVQRFDHYLVAYYCLLGVGSLVVFQLLKFFFKSKLDDLALFHRKYYLWLFWASVLVFTLWHIVFSGQLERWPIGYIITIQSVNAVVFSYVRIASGVVPAIVYHFAFNAPYIVINSLAIFL